ncbi:MAG TPA: redoxin domain-containing protein [Phycisphaerae bacterium]|nr:redoxin domain-containing protein [Phycisphaerae bacterium]HRY68885.1 redoxin domain-containing protein [Phycisphaerae bacterium]
MPCRLCRCVMSTLWLALLAALPSPAPAAPQSRPAEMEEAEPIDMTILFIRDPLVHKDLKLDADQETRIETLLDENDGPLFRARNLPPREFKAKADAILAGIEKELEQILQPQQRVRFDQIMLRTRGLSGFLQPAAAQALRLTTGQRRRIETIVLASQRGRESSGKWVVSNADGDERRPGLSEILAVLSDEQRLTWRGLLGPGFDVARLRPLAFKAPEFREVDTWLNAKPTTLAALRGQVVLIHFWTSSDVNCTRNYPAYRSLQTAYAKKSVTFIGIHTPETEDESDAETVRRKAAENKFTFAIAVDNDKYNWDAWGNQVRPAVYLVDKRGFVRFWWYGELGGKKTNGEKILRARLDALLAEKTGQATTKAN